jgi:cytochrome c2
MSSGEDPRSRPPEEGAARERPEDQAAPQPERDPSKLLADQTETDSAKLLEARDEKDPARLLMPHAESSADREAGFSASDPRGKYPPHHSAHHARHAGRWIAGALALVAVYAGGMALHEGAQERRYNTETARHMTGGDPALGPALMRTYGCAQCHTIPGVPGANGLVGPPLGGIGNRVYVGGVVTNTPDNLVRWIMNPKAIDSLTAMPVVGVTEEQARHIAAYLYTLR